MGSHRRAALRSALGALAASRVLVFAVAAVAAAGGVDVANAARFDVAGLTHALGGAGDALLTPLARWDAAWYLSIAWNGYGATSVDPAFFPLYPLLVWLVGGLGASPGSLLAASFAVSLAAACGALYLLHRLAALELGPPFAGPAVLSAAFFPASLFLGAPYSESVFLLTSVGAVYAARSGRWAWAGGLAAAASATRSAGILLLVPLAVLYRLGPRGDRPGRGPHPIRRDAAWLLVAPLGLAAYTAYLGLALGDPFGWLGTQEAWDRSFAGPLAGAWQAFGASARALGDLGAGGVAGELARRNLVDAAALAFAAVAALGVLRRLPLAYGLYVVCALALPLSFPAAGEPLMSLPRFVSVLFPVFLWLGLVLEERGWTGRMLVVSSGLLGVLSAWFATWEWVA